MATRPFRKISTSKIFVNKNNGQMSIAIPKKLVKRLPKKVELRFW